MDLGNFSVSLGVKDIKASAAFYEALGFTVCHGDIEQNWGILKNKTSTIGLFQAMFEKNIFTYNPGGMAMPGRNMVGDYRYVYQYKDHLSNIRLSYSDIDENGSIDASTEIIKENNYYPFGMLHKSNVSLVHPLGTGYTYGFNGKELQEGGDLAWMDFGSRNYDPALGRWMNIDPQAGRYMAMSPFAAMGNNPVTFVDPNGEELATGIIIGAVVGAIIGGTSTAIANPRADFGDILGGAFIGAFSGVVTASIGQAFAGFPGILEKGGLLPGLGQAGAHALFQGTMSAAQGGNFGQGAATAAASSLVGGATATAGPVGQSAMGAFTGGFTSLLTGGSFETGFATGLTVSMLNHALHRGAKGLLSNKDKDCCGYKEYFGSKAKEIGLSIQLNKLTPFRASIAAYTGEFRHVFGPDAIALSLNGSAGTGGGVKMEGGLIHILRGSDAGRVFLYEDFGLHATVPAASGTIASTELYFSGPINEFNRNSLFGNRWELNVGGDVGFAVGGTFLYAPSNNNHFVLGFGGSVGIGISATLLDINFGFGETKRALPTRNY